jgi:predicted RNA-binding Zn-ribbon protein involved in translation (DUF1610 family)
MIERLHIDPPPNEVKFSHQILKLAYEIYDDLSEANEDLRIFSEYIICEVNYARDLLFESAENSQNIINAIVDFLTRPSTRIDKDSFEKISQIAALFLIGTRINEATYESVIEKISYPREMEIALHGSKSLARRLRATEKVCPKCSSGFDLRSPLTQRLVYFYRCPHCGQATSY